MSQGGILCWDLARRAGWAYATPDCVAHWADRLPLEGPASVPVGLSWGTVTVCPPGQTHQAQYVLLFAMLRRMLREHRPRIVCLEAPLMFHKSKANQRLNIGYAALGELAVGLEVPKALLYEADNQDVKKFFTGSGGKKGRRVIEACQARGWAVEDDNAADALAILTWTIHHIRRARGHGSSTGTSGRASGDVVGSGAGAPE